MKKEPQFTRRGIAYSYNKVIAAIEKLRRTQLPLAEIIQPDSWNDIHAVMTKSSVIDDTVVTVIPTRGRFTIFTGKNIVIEAIKKKALKVEVVIIDSRSLPHLAMTQEDNPITLSKQELEGKNLPKSLSPS